MQEKVLEGHQGKAKKEGKKQQLKERMIHLVLGGKGFIGSHLIETLSMRGERVRCFDRPDPVKSSFNLDSIEVCEGDFLNEGDLKRALKGANVCYHLISTTLPSSSNDDPVFDVQTNVAGSIKLLELCLEEGVEKVVFISSGGTVYGIPYEIPIKETHPTNPICSYGITKLAVEKYLALFHHLYGLEYRILRVSNAYGERQRLHSSQGAVAVFLGKALLDEEIEIWGDGSVVRDYVYISDVIEALIGAAFYDGKERIFNIGSGEGRSLLDVLDTIERTIGRKVKRRHIGARKFDVPANVLSAELAKKELKWSPKVGFSEGVGRFANWLKENLR